MIQSFCRLQIENMTNDCNFSMYYFNRYIDNNGLSQIPDGSFAGQTNMQVLSLADNDIEAIQTSLFDDLTALKSL